MEKTFSVEIGGRPLQFSTGKVAKQANGAVVAAHGETTVLTTACITEKPRTGIDFFPLLVDFEERFYSAGKIPGGFIKREGRPSETAVLSCRMVDRSIRSLFDESMRYDVHVVSTVLSVDQVNPPNVLAINAASAALSISDIPWGGPVGAVRIGRVGDEFVVQPDRGADGRVNHWTFLSQGTSTGSPWSSAGRRRSPRSCWWTPSSSPRQRSGRSSAFSTR